MHGHLKVKIMLEVGIVTRLQTGQPRFCGSISGMAMRLFLLQGVQTCSDVRPAL